MHPTVGDKNLGILRTGGTGTRVPGTEWQLYPHGYGHYAVPGSNKDSCFIIVSTHITCYHQTSGINQKAWHCR